VWEPTISDAIWIAVEIDQTVIFDYANAYFDLTTFTFVVPEVTLDVPLFPAYEDMNIGVQVQNDKDGY